MQLFADYGCQKKELQQLNAVMLADITTADGRVLSSASWHSRGSSSHIHAFHWPQQPPSLSTAHWKLWQTAIETTPC
jgi:hypothetical protein